MNMVRSPGPRRGGSLRLTIRATCTARFRCAAWQRSTNGGLRSVVERDLEFYELVGGARVKPVRLDRPDELGSHVERLQLDERFDVEPREPGARELADERRRDVERGELGQLIGLEVWIASCSEVRNELRRDIQGLELDDLVSVHARIARAPETLDVIGGDLEGCELRQLVEVLGTKAARCERVDIITAHLQGRKRSQLLDIGSRVAVACKRLDQRAAGAGHGQAEGFVAVRSGDSVSSEIISEARIRGEAASARRHPVTARAGAVDAPGLAHQGESHGVAT